MPLAQPPTIDQFAIELLNTTTREERDRLLDTEKDLVTVELPNNP